MKLDFKKLVKPYEKESVSKLQEYIKICNKRKKRPHLECDLKIICYR